MSPRLRMVACAVAASAVSMVTVVPMVLIFGDRSLPFDYGHVYPASPVVAPGEAAVNVFTVKSVRKDCDGAFDRYMTDAKGTRFFLGSYRTDYRRGLAASGWRRFESTWAVPTAAAPGPALYETEPRFWCNWAQRVLPIHADPVRVRVHVAPHAGLRTGDATSTAR